MVEFEDHSPANQAAFLRYLNGEKEPTMWQIVVGWLLAGVTLCDRAVRKSFVCGSANGIRTRI